MLNEKSTTTWIVEAVCDRCTNISPRLDGPDPGLLRRHLEHQGWLFFGLVMQSRFNTIALCSACAERGATWVAVLLERLEGRDDES